METTWSFELLARTFFDGFFETNRRDLRRTSDKVWIPSEPGRLLQRITYHEANETKWETDEDVDSGETVLKKIPSNSEAFLTFSSAKQATYSQNRVVQASSCRELSLWKRKKQCDSRKHLFLLERLIALLNLSTLRQFWVFLAVKTRKNLKTLYLRLSHAENYHTPCNRNALTDWKVGKTVLSFSEKN